MTSLPATRQTDAIARPQTFEDMLRMAGAMQKSGFLPAAIKTPEQALAIMVAGREIGLGAMQAFRELYVVSGQVGMSTRLIAALYKQNGGRYTFPTRTAERCEVVLHLPDGSTATHSLTRKEADDAGFSKQKNKESQEWEVKHQWKAAPAQMLANNCLKQAIRIWYPECLLQALGVTESAQLPADPELAPLPGESTPEPAHVIDAEVTDIPQDGPPVVLPPDVQMIVEGLRDMATSKGGQRCKAGTLWSETTATDGQRSMLARHMDTALGEMASDTLRHDIYGLVFPGATDGLNMAQAGAMIDWLVEKDSEGKFALKPKAVEQVILLAGVATAQQEPPF